MSNLLDGLVAAMRFSDTIRDAGAKAYDEGKDRDENPWSGGSDEWWSWDDGWFQARRADISRDESRAWHEGYNAYQKGASWTDNPYPVNTEEDEWREWDAGWSQAKHEDE